jgi:hypothetical protein
MFVTPDLIRGPTSVCLGESGTPGQARGDGVDSRPTLEAAWLHLTRVTLPALAGSRDWPVSADHCFQRILLDHAVGGRWYDHVTRRPAYAHIAPEALARAVTLGEAVASGEADLHALNRQSLTWRGKRDRPS